MRQIRPFNFDWQFKPSFESRDLLIENHLGFELVSIPHQLSLDHQTYVDETIGFKPMCYRKAFVLDTTLRNRRVIFQFDAIAHHAKVYVNQQLICEHIGGYTAFEADATEAILWESTNWIVVVVDGSENPQIPPFGHVVDYLGYHGIYREVTMILTGKNYLKNLFVQTKKKTTELYTVSLSVDIICSNPQDFLLQITMKKNNLIVAQLSRNIIDAQNIIEFDMEKPRVWDIDDPQLYDIECKLMKNDVEADVLTETFGFRTFEFTKNGFFLNGIKRALIGLNRHQSYPHMGYAAVESLQRKDAEILKNLLHVNMVRTSHYPQSKHFIKACDELGLLVFTEIPGWQHIGDQEWQDNSLAMLEEMIVQYRNHPSIVLWGVRINESADDHEFYKKSNQIARTLDPSRPTSGVRNFKESELLEDVYSYNDFLHSGENAGCEDPDKICKNVEAPYIISEHNGHMYPVKSFDNQVLRTSQALRHSKVITDSLKYPRINAVIGWCMNDYQTHKDFGSGDKVCHHGVLDMYRQPKTAAKTYMSQQKNIYLDVDSSMSMGEYPSSNMRQVVVFTNCDTVSLYKNEVLLGEYEVIKNNGFNEPLVISDFIGNQIAENEDYSTKTADQIKDVMVSYNRYGMDIPLSKKLLMAKLMTVNKLNFEKFASLYLKYVGNWGSKSVIYTFVGKRKDEIIECKRSAVIHKNLVVSVDRESLVEAKTYDVVSITCEVMDQNQQKLVYFQSAISVSVVGQAKIIGPSIISFAGGSAVFYVRSIGKSGEATISIESPGFEKIEKKIYIEKR
ncbi:MAG: glycoside hydrolase family 2 protein [Erysipelothrix sp.]|nr:glycoside hydrolase family 2 protein [Erysipelothrix sp.]